MCGINGKKTSRWGFLPIGLAFSFCVLASDDPCLIDENEELIVPLLAEAELVSVYGDKVPVPAERVDFEFKLSEGRGQFFVHLHRSDDAPGRNPEADPNSPWAGIYSIMFTEKFDVSDDSNIFEVAGKCVIGDISVAYIRMKGTDGVVHNSTVVLLSFYSDARVVLFGDQFDAYLSALSYLNS